MNLKPFLSWCTAQGIVSPLDVREYRHGSSPVFRYTVLRDEIDRSTDKTRIFQAPLSACITAPSNEALADRLLYEKSLGDASQFALYLATLPNLDNDSYLSNLPRFWSKERLERVTDGGGLLEQVEMDARDRLQGRDPWAMAIVDSRCNLLADRSYALTPLMDFMNHNGAIPTTARVIKEEQQQRHHANNDPDDGSAFVLEVSTAALPPPVEVSVPDSEMVVAAVPEKKKKSFLDSLFSFKGNNPQNESRMTTSEDDLQRQHEVCISYGDLTNLQTLLNYGFVPSDGNPCNVEVLSVPLLGLPAPIAVECDARGRVDPLALGALRRALATPEELSTAQPKNEWSAQLETFSMSPYLTLRNELEVHAVLAGFLQQAVQDALQGAMACPDDTLVTDYLQGRAATLQLTLDKIQAKFPQVLLE